MRRGAKPAKAKGEAELPVARKSRKSQDSKVRDLENRLAESLAREKATAEVLQEKNRALTEALGQQAATREILRVISGSPTDVQPSFDAIAAAAATLCAAQNAGVFLFDGTLIHLAAHHHWTAEDLDAMQRTFPRPPGRGSITARAILSRAVAHVRDITEDPEYDASPILQTRVSRATLSVPMLRDGHPIGAITVARREPVPFTDAQIALLETFARQAVIAIENVRLFKETKEALEQQTATSEILQVISSSPTSVEPVFRTILANANTLCDASFSVLWLWDGQALTAVAHENVSPALAENLQTARPRPHRRNPLGLSILELTVVHVADVLSDSRFAPEDVPTYRLEGARSILSIPMIREGNLVGVINLWRREPRAFTDGQIALLKTFADQAVIAIENVRLFKELEVRNRALTESLEQQTATSEILRVISSSPTDIQPVFDTIVKSVARLCDGMFASLHRFDGDLLQWVAQHNYTAEGLEAMRKRYPMRAGRDTASGRAVIDRTVIHIRDFESDPDAPPSSREIARAFGYRSLITVPMLREGQPVGAIAVARRDGPFSAGQITLLQTFADQAVIAIENVRLFKELQERNGALTEAHAKVTESLEQQTATSEILRVIAGSPSSVQPVFDTIVQSAASLCHAANAGVFLTDGRTLDLKANYGSSSPEALATARAQYPRPLDLETTAGVAILTRSVIHVPDIEEPSAAEVYTRRVGRLLGVRSMVAVPMMRKGEIVGAINLSRQEPGRFSDAEVELLKTFADQAVIAIENVRLFTELQTSNRELTTALDTQTATSDILRVISGSQTDVQPVFDAIAQSAARLCEAADVSIFRVDGDRLDFVAHHGPIAQRHGEFSLPLVRGTVGGRSVLESRTVQVADLQNEDREFPDAVENARRFGFRTILSVPLLREDVAIGGIQLRRMEVQLFSERQIELLQTFADQAVIAIENVRLFTELQSRTAQLTRSVEQLTALGDVGRALSSTLDLDTVLQTIVTRASQLAGTDACSVFEYDEATEAFHLRATHNLAEEVVALARRTPTRKGEGVQGRMAVTRQPVQIPDIAEEDAYRGPLRDILLRTGTRAVLAIPMLRESELIGGLTVNKRTPGKFAPEVIELLTTFATQSALAIQNARLFRELADKGHQLEVASHHKSEFLANMSHELRTPLNAIIGFSEVLSERMFGDLNEKQAEYLKDIYASGQHLLSLINDILDLSKIEAGRMELELTDFDLPTAIENALTLIRERAGRRGIALHQAVDQRLGPIRGDERKIKQVFLNLLSNALKFTTEGGRIDVRAGLVDGMAEISVADTGVGIAPEDQEAVFEEFRQVGTSAAKQEGTGLGLTLCRKFIELHGGRIWVDSQVGVGSTFTFTIPAHHSE